MKIFFYCLLLLSFLSGPSIAQTIPDSSSIPTIVINAKVIGADSVIIPYNERYYVVPDTCTQIIRYGHYNFKGDFFYGKIKDVKSDDTCKIIAEGTYTKDGLKTGCFSLYYLNGQKMAQGNFVSDKYDGAWILYYPNGQIKANGAFKENKFIGKWELYYETGQPKLFFESEDGICKIMNAWTEEGKKSVDKGNGVYETETSWSGKLTNGLPDDIWICTLYSDYQHPSVTEYFKGNLFYRGHVEYGNIVNDYTDKSRISMFPELPNLLFNNSRSIHVRPVCDGSLKGNIQIKMFNKILQYRYTPLPGSKFYK